MEDVFLQFSELVDSKNPQNVLSETKTIIFSIFTDFDFEQINSVLNTVLKLFYGNYPGYRHCTTEYHNLQHTMDVFLAMTRLIHGAILENVAISKENVALGLISALFHDIGYIQQSDDQQGTGAKYTLVHVDRGIEFLENYFSHNGFSKEDFEKCRAMIKCTAMNSKMSEIKFPSREIQILGMMLGSADLLGQMADRAYLEKLLFLFYELKEGKVGTYDTEVDLLRNTLDFYENTEKRLISELGGFNRYMLTHFKKRWDIDKDLYANAIKKNRDYLEFILNNHEKEHREFLRREDIVKKLEDQGR